MSCGKPRNKLERIYCDVDWFLQRRWKSILIVLAILAYLYMTFFTSPTVHDWTWDL